MNVVIYTRVSSEQQAERDSHRGQKRQQDHQGSRNPGDQERGQAPAAGGAGGAR